MDAFFDAEDGQWLLQAGLYFINAVLLFFAGRLFFNKRHYKIDVSAELVKKDNFAFALANVGYYIALLIAIGGTLTGTSLGLQTDLLQITLFGLLSILLLNLSSWINDRFILRQFRVRKELFRDENAGTGIVEAANYIASGLIIYGAVSGDSIDMFPDQEYGFLWSGAVSMLVFWGVGQILLMITGVLYNAILPYNVHDEIEKQNTAAGMGFAGALIAMGVLIGHGTSGDFTSWTDHSLKIFFEVLIGFVFLPISRWIADWILLPGERLTHEIVHQEFPNKGAALVEAFAYIGSAVLIAWCL